MSMSAAITQEGWLGSPLGGAAWEPLGLIAQDGTDEGTDEGDGGGRRGTAPPPGHSRKSRSSSLDL